MRVDFCCGGNSFTISFLVCGVDGGSTKIGWRERGGWGKGIGDFELAGDLELIRISGSLLFDFLLFFFIVI